jgi:hypothetical protein
MRQCRTARLADGIAMVLQLPDEIVNFDAQRIGDGLEGLDSDVRFAALDFAHVGAVQARLVAELVLRPAALETKCADCSADLLLNILHSKAVWAYAGLNHTGYTLQYGWFRTAPANQSGHIPSSAAGQ